RQAGRPRQRLRPGSHLSRDLRAPVSAVGRDLERDPGALYSANLPTLGKQRRDLRRESADPATKDERQRLGLAAVSPLADENAGRSRHLAGPEISLPAADANEAEPVEIDVSVVAPLDVPEKDGFAVAVVRGLGERAGARDGAAAVVEPISQNVPGGDG